MGQAKLGHVDPKFRVMGKSNFRSSFVLKVFGMTRGASRSFTHVSKHGLVLRGMYE